MNVYKWGEETICVTIHNNQSIINRYEEIIPYSEFNHKQLLVIVNVCIHY